MRTGLLIEKLIAVSQSSKTNFARYMNMSPSGLSKILTGNRLPLQKEKKAFCRQAAAYFSRALFGPKCYAKLEDIFPIIYDFSTRQELEQFLSQSLQYAMDMAYAADNNISLDFPDREESFLGARSSLNMLCIMISDHIILDGEEPPALYTNLPMFSNASPDLFDRLIFTGLSRGRGLSFHYFISSSYLSSDKSIMGYPFLYTAVKMQEYGDLSFWASDWDNEQPFLLLKGRLLLVFSTLTDGSPMMTVITHKSFISSFFASLMKKGAKGISFSGAEAFSALREKPDFVNQLTVQGIREAYTFMSLNFLLEEDDFDVEPSLAHVKRKMLNMYRHILNSDTRMYLTRDIAEYFYNSGKLAVPLIGIVNIPLKDRLPYLARLGNYINKRPAGSLIILNSSMPALAALQSSEYTVLYLTDKRFSYEKFHVFKTGAIQRGLARDISSERFNGLPLSEEMWNTLMQELSASK